MSVVILIYIALIGYIYYTIFFANHTDLLIMRLTSTDHPDTAYLAILDRRLAMMRSLLYVAVSFISLFIPYLVMSASAGNQAEQLLEQGVVAPIIDAPTVVVGVIITLITTFIAFQTVNSSPFRAMIARYIPAYRPQSWVHNTGIVFMLLLLTAQIMLFFSQGGTQAMAESIESQGADFRDLLFQLLLQIVAAFLGIGWAIRRDWNSSLARLGLRFPTPQDLIWGIGGGFGLLGILWLFGLILGAIITLFFPDQMENIQAMNRANDSIANAFSTLPLALLLSASAAIGEEILFRGALLPIFGNVVISVFFALLHTQSLLSPAIILLFVVSLGLGHIRTRSSTTAAIIAHFVYNFAQLLLSILLLSSVGGI
ncbi:MAG: CPBP family intramembrane glutamic endopeptidase [bacterium]|nr:CPBP family intramembrane glutamic endopeptidase [bacterium]